MAIKSCHNCGEVFSGKATAKYCKPKCRVAAGRKKPEVTVASQTLGPPTETELIPEENNELSQEEKDALLNNPDPVAVAEFVANSPVNDEQVAPKKKKTSKKKNASDAKASNSKMSMKEIMAESRQRMNERLRAKGLPLILDEPEPEWFVPTGIGELDELTAKLDPNGSGGLPRKKITEIFGPKGSGKSSLVKTIMKQNPELRVLFFDAEGGMVGPPDNMEIIKGNIVEEIMAAVIEAVQEQRYDLIVIDSIASLVTRKQFEDDPEGKAAMARVFGPEVKRLLAHLRPLKDGLPDPSHGTAVVFINQFRSTTASFGIREYTVGGQAMDYYASLRLEFRSAKADYIIRDGKLAGQQIRVKVEKTRFGPKDQEFKFPLMFAELEDFNKFYMKRVKELLG